VRVAAVHTALNQIRGERRRVRRHTLAAPVDTVSGPEEVVLDKETRAELRRALSRLPAKSATVLVLRHGGMSYVAMATALDIKVGQVGTVLRRAESALRGEMNKEMNRGSRV
jgi:RNA polymerase sigma-70 factor (ECF subfamily)